MRKKAESKKCLYCTHLKKNKIYGALVVVLTVALLVTVVVAAKRNERAPRYSFAVSATGLIDGTGNTIDIHGGGKFSPMGGWGWGPSFWWWNVWIDAKGGITFVTAEGEEINAKWDAIDNTGLYDQLVPGVLNFTLIVRGRQPSWITSPIAVTLIEGTERTLGYITLNTGASTFSGAGSVVIK